jgi:integrase
MARTVNDVKLDTPAARQRLKPGRKPHWRTLLPSKLHLGYRRKQNWSQGVPGVWLARRYVGNERYRVVPLGLADDFKVAGGLSYEQAVERAYDSTGTRAKGEATVADAMAVYLTWLKAHRATGNDAERRTNKLILPDLGHIKIADLTSKQIADWRDNLASTPALARTRKGAAQNFRASPRTAEQKRARQASVNRVMSTLRAALNMAFRNSEVDDDAAWRRVKPFEKVTAARPGYLSREEAQRLVNAADQTSGFRDLVHAALLTGCRFSELCRLRVRDFHRGKLHITTSKSGRSRDVVLTEEGIAFFQSLVAGRAAEEPMLLRRGEAWKPSEQTRLMLEACRNAKIEPPVGFHQLRHSWASLAVMAGMPLQVIARNLGHSSTVMVEKHYGHLADSYIDAMIRQHAPSFGITRPTNVRALRKP